MTPSQHCIDFIESQEGCVLHPYLDSAGVSTIGYGTTRYPGGAHVTMKDPMITLDQANHFMECALRDTADAVNSMIPAGLNQNQFDALVSFAYNAGTGALHGSTALRLIKANPQDPAIRTALGLWDKIHVDGELRVSGDLARRRAKEADLYFSPIV